MDNKVELKERLRQAMTLRRIKAVELSERTGIPKGAISYYLAGKTEPKSDRVYLISKALDISEAWLLGYNVEMERTAGQKKNDRLAQLVARMRSDDDFYNSVSTLADLSPEQYASFAGLLSTLSQK